MKNPRISIHIATRDRATELALLLESLMYQTYKEFDVYILDGSKPKTILDTPFLASLVRRLRIQGHGVMGGAIALPGVCLARQTCLERDPWPENPLICRLDDDVMLEPDYLERLVEGITDGYDLVSGVTVLCSQPEVERETRFVSPIINKCEFDEKGGLKSIGDDCWAVFDEKKLVPTHHFRSCALYKRELHTKAGIDYNIGLSNVGFREEAWVSFRAILAGYKLAVHTGAVNWHLQCPSGGCRFPDYNQLVQLDEHHFRTWMKRKFDEHGDFLKEYEKKVIQ